MSIRGIDLDGSLTATFNPATGAMLRGGQNQMPLIVRLGSPTKKRQLVLKEDEKTMFAALDSRC